ncbi:MAG: PTS sugar transporter subunit IIC [Lachnospiraceae bacterium]|nr:PTS sugar transporter subunit IIC [Lachnospiraceae bacterium]
MGKPENDSGLSGWKKYCKEQNIEFSVQRILVEGLGGMAQGLFASLLIATIFGTIGTYLFDLSYTVWGQEISLLAESKTFATAIQGVAMACAIAYSMKAPAYVVYSCMTVGYAANSLGGAGGPLAVYVVTLIAVFLGKLVSKRTPIDLLVTPTVTILGGVFVATLIAPPIGTAASWLGNVIMWATNQQPFLMGILVSAIMGIILTLPISSAAICAALGLVGLAGGAAVAGCCAHMVGFAVASYRENGFGGLISQGLGTSMLQVPNLIKKPILWLPAVVASIVNGPVATCIFKLKMNGTPISSGMGTCGLVGPIGVITGWLSPSEAAVAQGEAVYAAGAFDWIGLVLVAIVIPAVVAFLTSEFMRKKDMIKEGDYKLEL